MNYSAILLLPPCVLDNSSGRGICTLLALWMAERLLAVPSGLIKQHAGPGVLREARGEAIEEYVHDVGIDLGEDEREGIVGGRPHA